MQTQDQKVLLIGSGGREHAIAWKLAQSPRLEKLYCIPGNPGIAAHAECVNIPLADHAQLVRFGLDTAIDLVVVGPEGPLADGLADAFEAAGIRVFGPSQLAAELEASKAFSKQFMQRHQIPSARFALFQEIDAAIKYVDSVDFPVVIKASGLAAGKGVFLPETRAEALACLSSMLTTGDFGAAGSEVVIEERLNGPEVSLLAFCDGKTVKAMMPAQDHKRLLDGDRGPNTGGMGAYAPAPVCTPALLEEATRTVLQATLDGMRAEGRTYVGVLYAGLMLDPRGVQVLEFNCRFGDPETQVLLPLLKTDLLEIALACVEGRLDAQPVEWLNSSAACVVLASGGYPVAYETGKRVDGLEDLPEGSVVFHAGTKRQGEEILSAGGRVLAVSGWAESLPEALAKAYQAAGQIQFEGKQFRSDIAHQALKAKPGATYASSGVNIDAGNRAVALMSAAVKSTYTPNVLAGIGAFGGLFAADFLKQSDNPVLVASTDGVGTKVKLAASLGRYRSVGMDIVNHCINDILVQGARPLFFLDYFATSALKPEIVAQVVEGISEACRASGCVLLGGETAEMPGVYVQGEFDVAGTIVGTVERARILPRADLQAGDVLVGLASSGPHTNGYSLIRRVFNQDELSQTFAGLSGTLADALLMPHRSYFPLLSPILDGKPGMIKALAHLTGGGFIENIPRILPPGLSACIHLESWPVPPLFQLIQAHGGIDTLEMLRVFNMGIGMVAVVAAADVAELRAALGEESWVIGELRAGERKVIVE